MIRLRLGLIALLVLLVAGACVSTPDPSARPSPTDRSIGDMTAALARNPLPVADLFDLTRRLKGRDGNPGLPFTPVRQRPPDEQVGTTTEFWTYDFDARGDGLHGYNVVKNEGGKLVFIKRVDFPVE